jgi:hypothetical protein
MSTRMHGSSRVNVCGDAMLSAEACQVVAVGSIATIICFLTVLAGRRSYRNGSGPAEVAVHEDHLGCGSASVRRQSILSGFRRPFPNLC